MPQQLHIPEAASYRPAADMDYVYLFLSTGTKAPAERSDSGLGV